MSTEVSELRAMIVAYAKQETLDPLRTIGGYLWRGVVGSVLLAVGLLLLALAALRALQQETGPHWTGNWSWVPYALTLTGAAVIAALLGSRIGAEKRGRARGAGAGPGSPSSGKGI